MNDEMMNRVIKYLEPMQIYTALMRTYYTREEMDDFDKAYVDFFTDFEDLVYTQLHTPGSPLMTLISQYQEITIEYEESLLHNCLEAVKIGYQNNHFVNVGKIVAYSNYIENQIGIDAKEFLNNLSEEEFYEFENKLYSMSKSELSHLIRQYEKNKESSMEL